MNELVEALTGRLTSNQKRKEDDFEKDGILYCGKCGAPRQAWIDWIPDADGKTEKRLVPIMCKCDEEEEKREKEEKAQHDFDLAMRHIRLTLYTMRDDVTATFADDTDEDNAISKTCRKYVERWEEMRKDNMGILFYGSKGTGKTFYASCIYNELLKNRILAGFTSTVNLMNVLSKWDKTDVFECIEKVRLLVLDDLGAERDTSYGAELMYSVIDARYKTGLPTIITTNLDLGEMKAETDIWRSRIYDRVIEMCPIAIPMAGESKRVNIADERKKKARELLRG